MTEKEALFARNQSYLKYNKYLYTLTILVPELGPEGGNNVVALEGGQLIVVLRPLPVLALLGNLLIILRIQMSDYVICT